MAKLPRRPGRKEPRFAHLLCGPVPAQTAAGELAAGPTEDPGTDGRIVALEEEVATLRSELEEIKKLLAD